MKEDKVILQSLMLRGPDKRLRIGPNGPSIKPKINVETISYVPYDTLLDDGVILVQTTSNKGLLVQIFFKMRAIFEHEGFGT